MERAVGETERWRAVEMESRRIEEHVRMPAIRTTVIAHKLR